MGMRRATGELLLVLAILLLGASLVWLGIDAWIANANYEYAMEEPSSRGAWLVVAAGAAATASIPLRRGPRRVPVTRPPARRCRRCGYDLAGVHPYRCPECGKLPYRPIRG